MLEEMGRGKAWAGMCERHLSWPGLALGLAGRHVGLSEWVCRSVNERHYALEPGTVPERSGEGGNSVADDWSREDVKLRFGNGHGDKLFIYGFSLATIKPPCMSSVHTEVQE